MLDRKATRTHVDRGGERLDQADGLGVSHARVSKIEHGEIRHGRAHAGRRRALTADAAA
jgi:hypothetical protein